MTQISGFRLRGLARGDAAEVAALIRAAFASIDPPPVPLPSALRETPESVGLKIGAGGGMAAEAAEGLAGVVLWEEREGGLYVGRLSVSAAWRRRGVARAMVEAAEVEAGRRGLPRLHVGVRLALAGNRALFGSLGFVEGALHAHEGFAAPTWVEMEKRLAP